MRGGREENLPSQANRPTINGDIHIDWPRTRSKRRRLSRVSESVDATPVEIAKFSFSPRPSNKNTRIKPLRGFKRDRRRASDVRFTRVAARHSNVTIGVVAPSVLTDDRSAVVHLRTDSNPLTLRCLKNKRKNRPNRVGWSLRNKNRTLQSISCRKIFDAMFSAWTSTKCLGTKRKRNRQRFSVDTSMFVLDISTGKSFSTQDFLDFYMNNYQVAIIKRWGFYTRNATPLKCKVYTTL